MADAAIIHTYLNEISNLAAKIEAVPNFPQDIWTMKNIDKMAIRIQELCRLISKEIGTGDGGIRGTGIGTGDGGIGGTGWG